MYQPISDDEAYAGKTMLILVFKERHRAWAERRKAQLEQHGARVTVLEVSEETDLTLLVNGVDYVVFCGQKGDHL